MFRIIPAVLVLGASGMLAQILLLREILVLFSGNEYSIGLTLGIWIAGEGTGALAGEFLSRNSWKWEKLFAGFTTLFIAAFPISLTGCRVWKVILGLPLETSSGTALLVLVACCTILPVAIIHGALFVISCSATREMLMNYEEAVARTFALETVGSIAGGAAATLVFLNNMDSFTAILIVCFANSLACIILFYRRTVCQMQIVRVFAILAIILSVLFSSDIAREINLKTVKLQWHGKNLILSRNSPYQNIALLESGGQYSLFCDGSLQLTVPEPDVGYLEELAHFTLLSHVKPEKILIVGGGAGGLINEILKHPSVACIDYVEPDAILLETVAGIPSALIKTELVNPKVHLLQKDVRGFLKNGSSKYDILFLNLPLPETLQANRLFTVEAMRDARLRLNPGGIVAIPASGSESYYSPELKRVNATLYATLKTEFPYVVIIPGLTNIFLCFNNVPERLPGPDILIKRFEARSLKCSLMNREHIRYKLDNSAAENFKSTLTPVPIKPNRDFSPDLLYDNLLYRSLMHSTMLRSIQQSGSGLFVICIVIVLIIVSLFTWRSPERAVLFSVAATGWCAMSTELALMVAFQVYYSSLYHQVGMLLALFMAGVALGAGYAASKSACMRDPGRFLVAVDISLILLPLVVVLSIGLSAQNLAVILFMILLTGFLAGVTYPTACRLYGDPIKAEELVEWRGVTGSGAIYAADLFGGAAGGIIGALLILPQFGIYRFLFIAASFKMLSAIILTVNRRR